MKEKLLNVFKNLIFILTLVFILINISATSVFADSAVGINVLMRQKISGWYLILRNLALALMLIALFLVGFRLFIATTSSRDKALFKQILPDWVIGVILVFFIHYFMYAVIHLNENFVDKSKGWGMKLSGLDLDDDTDGEITLYESSMSKAYEIKYTSGTIGMIMYMILVFYTYKFVLVYAKRYVNVIILILLAPILIVIDSFKKLISGANDRLMKRWFKEFIYNVCIQSVHAISYASLVGLTLRLSENTESFIGAILTLMIFAFIFKLDGIIRKIFNFVGGKTTIRQIDLRDSIKTTVNMGRDFKNGEGALYDKVESIKGYFQDTDKAQIAADAGSYVLKYANRTAKNVKNFGVSVRDGSNIKVTAEEIQREKEKMENPNWLRKLHVATQGMAIGAIENIRDFSTEAANKIKKKFNVIKKSVKEDISKLQQNAEMAKRLPKIIKAHAKNKKQKIELKTDLNDVSDINQTVVDLDSSPKEVMTSVKEILESESEDLVAEVYKLEGPQAFLYPETGSPYMGMTELAVTRYESRYQYAYMENEMIEKRTVSAPAELRTDENFENDGETEEDVIIAEDGTEVIVPKKTQQKKPQKRYKFNRFNATSTKAIVQHLNSRIVFSDKKLTMINQIKNKIDLGTLQVSGNFKFRRTFINYTAKMKSARMMKKQMDISLLRYEQRAQDSRWARVAAIATDIKMTTHNRISAELLKIKQSSAVDMALTKFANMGIVRQIDDRLSLVFEKVGDKAYQVAAPFVNVAQSIKDKITTKVMVVQAVIDVLSYGQDAFKNIGQKEEKVQPQIFVNSQLGQHIVFNPENGNIKLVNSVTGEQVKLDKDKKIVFNEETGIPMIVNVETGEQIMFNESIQDVITGNYNDGIKPNALLQQQLLINNETGQHIIFNAEIGKHVLIDITTGQREVLDENSNKQIVIDEETGQTILVDKETGEQIVFDVMLMQNVVTNIQQPVVQSIFGMNSESAIVNIIPASVLEAHPMIQSFQNIGVISQEQIVQFVVAENGEIVQQVLDLDGNIVMPAQAEDGSILKNTINSSGQIVQHIMSMEGTIVQQFISVTNEGASSVMIQNDNQTGIEVSETSYEVQSIVEEMRSFVFEQVSTNLSQITKTGEVQTQVLDIAQMVNEIGNVEAAIPVDTEKKMADLDNLINQITPELVEVSRNNREPEKKALEMTFPDVPQTGALEAMADYTLIETAIESEVYNIKELDIQNEETKLKVLDSLVEKGIVSTQVKNNEVVREEILEVMEERRQVMSQEKPDAVFDELVQRDFADAVRSDISTGAITPDTLSTMNVEKHMDSLSEALAKAALEKVKTEIKSDTKKVENVVKEEIATAKRVYGDVKPKGDKTESDNTKKSNLKKNEKERMLKDTEEGKHKNKEYTTDDKFRVYLSGAVTKNRVDVPISTTIQVVVKDYATEDVDWDGLRAWLKESYGDGIDINKPVTDGMMIFVPSMQKRKNDVVDDVEVVDNENDETNKMLERCRPVVEKVIKEYIIEYNIQDPETLRKLMHRNMIASELQKLLKREDITRKQIEDLIEERIRQVKAIRTAFADAKDRARIIDNNTAKVKDEDVTEERKRLSVATKNTEEEMADEMVKQAVASIAVQGLLEELNRHAEKVLSSNSEQQAKRSRYMDTDPYTMINNMIGTYRKSGMV